MRGSSRSICVELDRPRHVIPPLLCAWWMIVSIVALALVPLSLSLFSVLLSFFLSSFSHYSPSLLLIVFVDLELFCCFYLFLLMGLCVGEYSLMARYSGGDATYCNGVGNNHSSFIITLSNMYCRQGYRDNIHMFIWCQSKSQLHFPLHERPSSLCLFCWYLSHFYNTN